MKQIKTFVVPSRLGPMYGAAGPDGLLALVIPQKGEKEFKARLEKRAPGAAWVQVEPEELPAGRQLLEYLRGKRKKFTVRPDLSGLPPFHQLALSAVKDIPYAQTSTYGQIAALVGRPKASRAVGQANGANPLPLFIP